MNIPMNTCLEEVEGAVRLAELVMKLGEVERATRHPDGRPETDTTHTVMLALVALRLAEVHNRDDRLWPDDIPMTPVDGYLDTELVLKFALVHDLVEAIAGDVNTIRPLDPEQRAEKDRREAEALDQISADHPWLGTIIRAYEGQKIREARFVRYLDKCMPKLTHLHNGCRTVREAGMTREELEHSLRRQINRLTEASPDLELAREFFEATSALCLSAYEDLDDRADGHPGSPPVFYPGELEEFYYQVAGRVGLDGEDCAMVAQEVDRLMEYIQTADLSRGIACSELRRVLSDEWEADEPPTDRELVPAVKALLEERDALEFRVRDLEAELHHYKAPLRTEKAWVAR